MKFHTNSPNVYFAFVLFSTTCRSFESGVVASLMGTIKADLHMSYSLEGIVAASPDFGIVPAGVLAIFIFQYFPAYRILVLGQFVIGLAALLAVAIPTAWSLIIARALGGLFWGFAAVHYPSWINKYGGENETVWLGLFNSCLLIGILIGYTIGAIADTTDFITWRHLYGFEAVLMLITGILYCFIDPKLIQVLPRVRPLNVFKVFGGKCFVGGGDAISGTHSQGSRINSSMFCNDPGYEGLEQEEVTDDEEDEDGSLGGGEVSLTEKEESYQAFSKLAKANKVQQRANDSSPSSSSPSSSSPTDSSSLLNHVDGKPRDPNKIRAREAILAVLTCPLYIWTVSTGAIISGAVCFILYFITQVLKELHFFGTRLTYIMVGIIFVLSPIPGNIFGAWYVQNKLGGYRNFVGGLRFTWQMTFCSFIACVVLTVAALMKSARGSSAGPVVSGVFVTAFYLFLFAGAAPTATINGTAVSLLPKTSIAGSGVQFSFQNTGRLIIPAIGGVLIDLLGDKVVLGFQLVLLIAGGVAIIFASAGYREALKREKLNLTNVAPSSSEQSNSYTNLNNNNSTSSSSTSSPSSSSDTYGGVIIDDSFDDHITL